MVFLPLKVVKQRHISIIAEHVLVKRFSVVLVNDIPLRVNSSPMLVDSRPVFVKKVSSRVPAKHGFSINNAPVEVTGDVMRVEIVSLFSVGGGDLAIRV